MSLLSILLNVSRICMQYKTTHILFWTNYSFQIVLCAVTCMIHKIKDCCAKPIAQFTNHEQLPWPKASSTPLSCLDDGSLSKSRSDQHVIQQRAFQRIVDHCERSDGNKMIRLTIHRVVCQANIDTIIQPVECPSNGNHLKRIHGSMTTYQLYRHTEGQNWCQNGSGTCATVMYIVFLLS